MADRLNFDFVSSFNAHRLAMSEGDFASAERLGNDVLRHAVDLMIAEAQENGPPLDLLLLARADECEDRGDWSGAIAAYREALSLALQS